MVLSRFVPCCLLAAALALPAHGAIGAPSITITTPDDTVASTTWYNLATAGTDGVHVHVSANDLDGLHSLTCTDTLSSTPELDVEDGAGPQTLSGDFTLPDGVYNIDCEMTDATDANAGSAQASFSIDTTKPTVSGYVTPYPVVLHSTLTVHPNSSDATSGIATQSCDTPTTAAVGTFSFNCSATDNAGNSNSALRPVLVGYNQHLLYSLNLRFKAGSTFVLKLQLTDANKRNVSAKSIKLITSGVYFIAYDPPVVPMNKAFTFVNHNGKKYYKVTVNTSGLSPNEYYLEFTAGADPITHLAQFGLK